MNTIYSQILLSFVLATTFVNIEAEETTQSSEPRICSLLEGFGVSLAIEPAVPDNFVALSKKETPHALDWTFWGPKDVLEDFFKDPSTLDQALIRVSNSLSVIQTGPEEFNGSTEKLIEEAKASGYKDLSARRYKWGIYPIVEVTALMDGREVHMAWVGMNDRGLTLVFALEVPKKRINPNDADKKLWDDFLQNTRRLTGYEFYRVYGEDMHTGYTIYDFEKRNIKAIAEKREKDNAVQVIVQPLSPNTTFELDKMEECLHEEEWRFNEPIVKLYGEGSIDDDRLKVSEHFIISIFIQSVKEFTDASKIPNAQVYSMKEVITHPNKL